MGCAQSVHKAGRMDLIAIPEGCLTVFGDQYVVRNGKNMLLHLKEKIWSLSNDGFEVRDMNNDSSIVFLAHSKGLLSGDKLRISDAQERAVFSMKTRALEARVAIENLRASFWVACDAGNTHQFTEFLRSDRGIRIALNGNLRFQSKDGLIWHTWAEGRKRAPIARMCNHLSLGDTAKYEPAQDDYFVEIASGVDAAIILAIVLACEEFEAPMR